MKKRSVEITAGTKPSELHSISAVRDMKVSERTVSEVRKFVREVATALTSDDLDTIDERKGLAQVRVSVEILPSKVDWIDRETWIDSGQTFLPASNRGQINYPGIPLSRKTVKAFQSIKKHDALSNIDRSAIAVTGLLLDDYYASGDGLTKRQIAEVTNYQIQAVTEAFSKLLGMLLDNKEDDQKKFLPKNLMLFRKKSGHQEDTLYKLFREGMEKRNFVRTRSRRHNDTSHD